MAFHFAQSHNSGATLLLFSGYIDEMAKFPDLPTNLVNLRIDMKNVNGINSIGTRLWCQWVSKIQLRSPAILENCPAILIKTFNNVLGAYPKTLQVNSFFVPYISSATEIRQDILFVMDQEFKKNGEVKAPVVRDERGTPLELDVMPEYFRFLQR